MATAAQSTNVVRLPTAPKRKVQQNYNRATRAAKANLPKFPSEYVFPGIRAAMSTAETLIEMRQALTPEMELLTAICAALDDTARIKVAEVLAPGVVIGRKTAVQAFAVLRSTRMTVSESLDLDNAMRRIGGR